MSKQLERLAEFEREKEQREARYYKQAQQNVNQQKQKLTSLEQYRIDYIKGIQQTGQAGCNRHLLSAAFILRWKTG